jgi:hypothetical protein
MQTMRFLAYQRPSQLRATSLRDCVFDERCRIVDSPYEWQQPLLIDGLVQLFVVGTRYLPQTARRQLDPADLPPALERVAMHAQRCLQTWFAWTDGPRVWFFVTELASVPGLNRGQQALRLFFYDEEGRFVSWGTWALHLDGGWVLCER